MANVKFNKRLFEKEIGKLSEEMQSKISMFGVELEGFNDEEIEIDVFPNRPDLLSYQGFKRSFLAFIEKEKGLKEYKLHKPERDYVVKIDSSVKDIRPYTACAVVKGLKFDDDKIKEVIDLQEKLHTTVGRKRKKVAIGIYPLEKIELPITFKALEPDKIRFRPLESEREMSGLEILQRHPTGRDYAHLLAGKVKFPFFIDSKNQILSMPPIINSHLTGKISESTKDVFIECSGFDFEILKKCLNILVTSLADIGGEIYQMKLGYRKEEITPNLNPDKIKISVENTNKLLGLKLSEKEVVKFLERMGHNYNKGAVEIPAWRTDVLHEVDLIEDVAIAYGYENLIPEIPRISTIGQENPKETVKRKIGEILAGLGMLEVSNYHLTTKSDQFLKQGFNKIDKNLKIIEIEESKTDYNLLRQDLKHLLLKNLSENVDSEYPQKIFETGKVFSLNEKNEIVEKENLAMAITPGNFTEIRQIFETLFRNLNLKIEIKEPEVAPEPFIEGRVAEIFSEGRHIGFMGEVHPKILRNWKTRMPVGLLEIDLEEIFYKLMF